MLTAIKHLFDASKNLEDGAFKCFIDALRKLSAEIIGMQAGSCDGSASEVIAESGSLNELQNLGGGVLSPPAPSIADTPRQRGVSEIHLPRTKLDHIAWTTSTIHLLSAIRLPTAPPPIRIEDARVLDEVLITVPHFRHPPKTHHGHPTPGYPIPVGSPSMGIPSRWVAHSWVSHLSGHPIYGYPISVGIPSMGVPSQWVAHSWVAHLSGHPIYGCPIPVGNPSPSG
ncbi:hypothetical protein C8R42DRAFT_722380 [Lentinula raphanica]|nr:hypothetical protein C8R42DRAFT_722380 [Lentinula raphanica]